jgi:histidyl-tRNA synthetase
MPTKRPNKAPSEIVTRDLPGSHTKFVNCEHLDRIGEIAAYYGFTALKSPNITKADIEASKDILDGDYVDDPADGYGRLPLHAEEKVALIRTYHEENMHIMNQPVMLYFKDPYRGAVRKDDFHRYADLEILGNSGSIADATLIATARVMLEAEGYAETAVEINSIGDRDSIARFSRELTAYYKKQLNDMDATCRNLFREDPFELLTSRDAACKALNDKAPRSMDFLSEDSRRHLEEVLEYLEALGIPYSINNGLIGNRKYCTETVFTIVNKGPAPAKGKNQRILALGVRYNGLAKRLNMKRDIQGVGISLLIPSRDAALRKPVTKIKRPIAAFMQLGLESKLVALKIVEELRQAKIPLYLSLAKDRLGAQVSSVERYHTPYVIVMGKKEAVDGTAIVRKTDTHSQDVVPLAELAAYMKKAETAYYNK